MEKESGTVGAVAWALAVAPGIHVRHDETLPAVLQGVYGFYRRREVGIIALNAALRSDPEGEAAVLLVELGEHFTRAVGAKRSAEPPGERFTGAPGGASTPEQPGTFTSAWGTEWSRRVRADVEAGAITAETPDLEGYAKRVADLIVPRRPAKAHADPGFAP